VANPLDKQLERWTSAGVVDASTAARIRKFEESQGSSERLRWPVLLAVALGGVLLCAGVLLFVAAHWDELSPAWRFSLVLILVAVFPIAGNRSSVRAPAMGNTATRIRTSVNRQAGESSSQCAATNSKTPAQSSTPPSATASRTGQRNRSLEPCDSSNVRMRSAVPASTTPAETHRSSRFPSALAMRGPPLVPYSSPT